MSKTGTKSQKAGQALKRRNKKDVREEDRTECDKGKNDGLMEEGQPTSQCSTLWSSTLHWILHNLSMVSCMFSTSLVYCTDLNCKP